MKYQIQNVSIRNIWIACVCKINDVKKFFLLLVSISIYTYGRILWGKLDIFGIPLFWVDDKSENISKG